MTILTVAQMYAADRAAIASGLSEAALMNAAGFSVAQVVQQRWVKQPVAVLCGPGNNGGDGFVAAQKLARAGWPVQVFSLGKYAQPSREAARAAALWKGEIEQPSINSLEKYRLIIDALFGSGLTRPLDAEVCTLVKAINDRKTPVISVDIPSGLHGDTGTILGSIAFQAEVTVTFFRPKLSHFLLPGRLLCGSLVVADIGIPESVLSHIKPKIFVNTPDLWRLPKPRPNDYKYKRGHALVVGGSEMTGAVRLAARAARRIGVGLLTVASPEASCYLYAQDAPGILVTPYSTVEDLPNIFSTDHRYNATLIGPGIGRSTQTRKMVECIIASKLPSVLDADALTSFSDSLQRLPTCHASCVLTPHEGEYNMLFRNGNKLNHLEKAQHAAHVTGAVVLLKGSDTIIASPDGRTVVNINAPPVLATAGSGDVLAGLITGLLGQGLDAFSAACSAVWLHSAAATYVGSGLIAEDLIEIVPTVMQSI